MSGNARSSSDGHHPSFMRSRACTWKQAANVLEDLRVASLH